MKGITEKKSQRVKRWKEYEDGFALHLRQASNPISVDVGDLAAQRAGKELGIYGDKVNADDDMGDRCLNIN